jgi:hypothetical protein
VRRPRAILREPTKDLQISGAVAEQIGAGVVTGAKTGYASRAAGAGRYLLKTMCVGGGGQGVAIFKAARSGGGRRGGRV